MPAGEAGGGAELAPWPPPGAASVDLAGGYERLAARGYGYGPAFRGLRAAWERGEELFCEVELDQAARGGAAGFGLHPALLDAVMHAALLSGDDDGQAMLPFAWQGVTLHASGATALRARMTPAGPGAVAIDVTDQAGQPVLTIQSITSRPINPTQLNAPNGLGV